MYIYIYRYICVCFGDISGGDTGESQTQPRRHETTGQRRPQNLLRRLQKLERLQKLKTSKNLKQKSSPPKKNNKGLELRRRERAQYIFIYIISQITSVTASDTACRGAKASRDPPPLLPRGFNSLDAVIRMQENSAFTSGYW